MSITFKLKLAPTIATAIVLPILMSLGYWQLDRAELKQQQLEIYTARSKQAAVRLQATDKVAVLNTDDMLYTNIEAQGHYDSQRSFLIDNRVHNGEVGFDVITPLIIGAQHTDFTNNKQSKNVVLVNRGWIKGNRYRSELPKFETTDEKILIKGHGYIDSRNFFAVDNVKIDTQNYPVVIQSVDFIAIQQALGMNVYPFVLRLEPKDKTGFLRDWQVVTSSPEKSQSYAAQWFTMALVVAIIFMRSCFKIKRETTA